jgi:hypothetical protein
LEGEKSLYSLDLLRVRYCYLNVHNGTKSLTTVHVFKLNSEYAQGKHVGLCAAKTTFRYTALLAFTMEMVRHR